MIKITNEINGMNYEFVTKKETDSFSCIDCDFWSEDRVRCMAKRLRVKDRLCDSRLGIWKEVKDED